MKTKKNKSISSRQRPNSFGYMMQQIKEPILGRPISPKENLRRVFAGEKPMWMPAWLYEVDYCWSDEVLEHPKYEYDGFDWFGVEWVWVEVAGGMMVKPGTRTLSDITKWKEEVIFPDLDSIDWESDAAIQTSRYDNDRMHVFHLTEGIFERLHELMPFEDALAAMIEDPEYVLEFFEAMADYKIKLLSKIFKYYEPIDFVIYGDDWGTQRAGFFSNEMFKEMIYPSAKRVMDYIKSQGKFIELHSCGLNQQYVPFFKEMGIDLWTPQSINDSDMLKNKYGSEISFCFVVEGLDDPNITEEGARQIIRDFVDKYAKGGRAMAQIFAPPEVLKVCLDELYNYSLNFYLREN
ncbi:methyltransferase [Romboutsia ilealis]|uniref:Methyltransferase n=1 Tax=Romboutsia faecis TaxID=2764597 RepID=A0ABR7JS18_9FIRM|nr:uroporphyrinogen decarboxylase family protein [Romboutsia faecis]MBC5997705.1 methyltransferase [Romboutsia faecis]MRN25347.1 methyltransferase [Romboutsia ilealis]